MTVRKCRHFWRLFYLKFMNRNEQHIMEKFQIYCEKDEIYKIYREHLFPY